MKEWKKFQEEAAKRDHRKLGRVGLLLTLMNNTTYLKEKFVSNPNADPTYSMEGFSL